MISTPNARDQSDLYGTFVRGLKRLALELAIIIKSIGIVNYSRYVLTCCKLVTVGVLHG